jgi:glycosyltransferase 2 family protein
LRKHLHLIIGILISAVAVFLSLQKIDFPSLWASLRSVNYLYLIPAVVCQFFCFALKGVSWRYLLTPAKKGISFTSTISVLVIGLMVNDLFPAKMGELARAYLMGSREKLSKTLCLSTIVVEHLVDILVLSLFLLILLPSVSLPAWLRNSGLMVGLAALAIILILFGVMHREESFFRWIGKILIRLPEKIRGKIQSLLTNIFQGFRVVKGRYIFYSFVFLLAMWCMACLIAYLVLGACGLFLPIQAAVMVVVFTAFGKIIPSSPGAIGTYHYLVILVLMPFGISKEAALGYGLIIHALAFLLEIALGILLVLAGNLSLAKITRQAEEST